MFTSGVDEERYREFLSLWKEDGSGTRKAFLELVQTLSSMEGTILSFHIREGVSYSLRASLSPTPGNLGPRQRAQGQRPYYALMDIVEEAGEGKWLSVCFYRDQVTDPEDKGNLIPKGLLDEDGYCFDVDQYDKELIYYLEARIKEAHRLARHKG